MNVTDLRIGDRFLYKTRQYTEMEHYEAEIVEFSPSNQRVKINHIRSDNSHIHSWEDTRYIYVIEKLPKIKKHRTRKPKK